MEHQISEEQAQRNLKKFKGEKELEARKMASLQQRKAVEESFQLASRIPFHSLIALDTVKVNYQRKRKEKK